MIAAIFTVWLIIFVFILAPLAWLVGTVIGKVYAHVVLAVRKRKTATEITLTRDQKTQSYR